MKPYRQHIMSTVAHRAAWTIGLAGIIAGAAPARAQSTPAEAAESSGVEEIIVTAQRREEKLQNVPISVTAISGATMAKAGITGTLELAQAVPSVQLTNSGPQVVLYIRGVGNSSAGIGEEGANAIYVDGVYIGDQTSMDLDFNSIERVEVLKGPQGTLFGRNSSGGLIHVITREPGDEVKVKANIGYANYKTFKGQLYVASPITSNLSADIAFTGSDQNKGWGRNLATGKEFYKGWKYAVRSKFVWRPGDATKVTLSGDYRQMNNTLNTPFTLFRGSVGLFGFRYFGDYNINSSTPGYHRNKAWGTALTVEHEFDWATLTSLSSVRNVHAFSQLDSDYIPTPLVYVPIEYQQRYYQQEFRLSSATTTPLSWQLGLFYYHANAVLDHQTPQGLSVGGIGRGFDLNTSMKTESVAVFGEATYVLTETTHLTGGLRYTHDKRSYRGRQVPFNQPVGSAFEKAFNIPLKTDSATFSKVTYRLAIRQELSDKVNVYASFNTGLKSGIYSLNAAPLTNPVLKPQTVQAFEVGLKSQLFDNMLRLNVAGFHYKIKNYQVRSASPALGAQAFLLNAAAVKVDGVEAEFEFVPVRELRIVGNATYLKSRFTSFPTNSAYIPNPAVCTPGANPPGRTTGALTGGNTLCIGSATGNRTPQSPRFAASLGATYTMQVGSQGEVIANVQINHTGKVFFESDNRLFQRDYNRINAALEYRPSPNWGIEVYGKNLTDRHAYVSATSGGTGDQGQLGAPRTYGVNVKFDF